MNTVLWYSFCTVVIIILFIGAAVATIGLLSLLLELWDDLKEDWKEHVHGRKGKD